MIQSMKTSIKVPVMLLDVLTNPSCHSKFIGGESSCITSSAGSLRQRIYLRTHDVFARTWLGEINKVTHACFNL